jgi:hypothetical protein
MSKYLDTYSVYKHTNKYNNKIYIGITKQNPIKRWANGKGYKINSHFRNAIEKYGWDNFTKYKCEKPTPLGVGWIA